jgi:hypothetical protein
MNPSRRADTGCVEIMCGRWRGAEPPESTATLLTKQGNAGREQPAPLMEPSTTTRRGTSTASRLACGAGSGKSREHLLDLLPSALGARWRLLGTCQYEFLEDVAAVETSVFKDRHGKLSSLLRIDATAFWLGILRPGGPAAHSGKAGNSWNAWQYQEPNKQKENVNQEAFHNKNPAIRLCDPRRLLHDGQVCRA